MPPHRMLKGSADLSEEMQRSFAWVHANSAVRQRLGNFTPVLLKARVIVP
jgi:hypothetical protein